MIKLIPADDIIDIVKNTLNIYFEAGSIDDSLLYPQINNWIGSLGVQAMSRSSATLNVENYTATLPDDFYSLILALACKTYKFKENNPKGIISYEKRICALPTCKTTCDYGRDSKGLFQIYQHIEDEWYTHQDLEVLSISKTSTGCDLCENPRQAKDKYSIDVNLEDKTITTQFESGSIYIEYRQEKDELMVPDYPEIREWIESELTAFIFKTMWYVMDGDVYNRFQYAVQEAGIKKHNALAFWRRNKPSDFKNLRNELIKNANKLARV